MCTAWRSPGWLQPEGASWPPQVPPLVDCPDARLLRPRPPGAVAVAVGAPELVPVAWQWRGDEAWDGRRLLWQDDLQSHSFHARQRQWLLLESGLDACCMQCTACICYAWPSD